MIKIVRWMVTLMVLTCTLTMVASAAVFEDCADTLYELGLFQGGTDGYELDREPTRAEAAVMLTRMLGQETAALADYEAGNISHPFTDTDPWMDAYIAYLYVNGYTTGSTATTFDPQSLCSDQMYVTFLLRSLGYFETEGDFTYAESLTFGKELGLVDGANLYGDVFLRDHVVALTVTALTIVPKNGEDMLFDLLKAEGVVPEGTAFGVFLEEYQVFLNDLATGTENATVAAQGHLDMNLMFMNIEVARIYVDMDMVMVGDFNAFDPSSMSLTVNTGAESQVQGLGMDDLNEFMGFYIVDGWCYTDASGGKTKEQLDTTGSSSGTSGFWLPVSVLSTCTVGDGTYEMTVNGDTLTLLLGDEPTTGNGLSNIVLTFTVEEGEITSISGVGTMDFVNEGIEMDMLVTLDIAVESSDETQTINFPSDLDSYQEVVEAT